MRSREEAEDALQSTFLRVHKALAKGVVPEFEAAWLYKIAHNVCLSRRDVIGRYGRLETAQDLDEIEYALAAPEQHHDELVGLSDALAGLPANLRQALLLREWQGLSYAEIADAMGTTVSAVETLIFRARRELAASLEVDGKRRKRPVAGLLDIGLLLSRLRALLGGAAPAKLATGAVLVAVGGAGIGSAVVIEAAGGAPRRPHVVAAAPVSAAFAPVLSLAAPLSHAATPTSTTLTFTPPPAASTPGATRSAAPAASPAAAAPQAPVSQGGGTRAAVSTTTSLVPAAPSLTTASASTGAVTVPALPGVSAPAVPGIAAPPLAPPTVSAPTVSTTALPSVPLPSTTTQLPVSLTP